MAIKEKQGRANKRRLAHTIGQTVIANNPITIKAISAIFTPENIIFMKRMREGDGRKVVERAGRSAFYHWLRAFLKRNGLPHIDVHSFRRMAASYCLNNQVPLTTIRQMLGHKDLETTMIYLRSLEVNRKTGTQVLSDAYRRLLDNKKTSADTTAE